MAIGKSLLPICEHASKYIGEMEESPRGTYGSGAAIHACHLKTKIECHSSSHAYWSLGERRDETLPLSATTAFSLSISVNSAEFPHFVLGARKYMHVY